VIRRRVEVMGTVVSFAVQPGRVGEPDVFLALAEARRRLLAADAVFSTWKPASPLSRLRRGEISIGDCPPEVATVAERCARAREASAGWFDPWALPGGFDPTGLVKGWAAARALHALGGVDGAMVSAGGDIALSGRPGPERRWRVGIQDPFDRSRVFAVAEPVAAIATSGGYERGAHIADPRTGRPAAGVASATVTGPELDLADALATAVVAGGDEAFDAVRALPGYEALVVGHDGQARASAGFPFPA
jgi:thiamine biosynthesis lipoprotein